MMKIILRKLTIFFLCCVMILTTTACGGGQEQEQEQDSENYTVTFDLNYEGAKTETRSVKANTRTTSYVASRSGYELEGWYRTAECVEGDTFDFASYIESDITLYAKWIEIANSVTITFDPNYSGGTVVTVDQEEGKAIKEMLVPSCSRLGREYSGWYTDAKCTQKWDMASPVNQSMTLYAGYKFTNEVPRDRAGNIIYKNVTVNMFLGADLDTSPVMKELIEKFNSENEGRIKVVAVTKFEEQADYALRFQQIPGANATYLNYYTVNDVYDLANLKLKGGDWYEQATRNCYIDEKMYSVPVVAGVPFLIYNKELMSSYNGNRAMPSNYETFSELLLKAYNAESKENTGFKSIVTHTDWTFKEATSSVAFIQNGADYYVYEDGVYKNNWGNSGDASYTAAHTAFVNLYNMFGKDGSLHGGLVENDYSDKYTISAVWKRNALMGIINIPNSINSLIGDDSLGVLPLSGLFAASGSKQANQIPIHSIGFQFYKAENVSLVQLAAAAKFVDYVSRNSLQFAEKGWYPLRKAVVESDDFRNSTNETVKFLQQIGNPNQFRTFDGHASEKKIVNTVGADGNVVPLLGISDVTSEDLKTSVDYFKRKITAVFN